MAKNKMVSMPTPINQPRQSTAVPTSSMKKTGYKNTESAPAKMMKGGSCSSGYNKGGSVERIPVKGVGAARARTAKIC